MLFRVSTLLKKRFLTVMLAALAGALVGFHLANRKTYMDTPDNIVFVRDELPYIVNIYRSNNGHSREVSHHVNNAGPEPATPTTTTTTDMAANVSRKIFLDCGSNVANTVTLFRETYPDGKDYIIHSFDIDERLNPFFGYYTGANQVLHCPVGVTDTNGNMTAYSESAWYPGKQTLGMDVQWGGGALFVDEEEKHATLNGGRRRLSHRRIIPTVDLSMWIQKNTKKEDYVILKLDVEGAEYALLRKMLKDGTFAWIDKFYGEFHDWEPTGDSRLQKYLIRRDVINAGYDIIGWAAETRTYADFDEINVNKFPDNIPGEVGKVLNTCRRKRPNLMVTMVIEVGMNAKRACKLLKTIEAYPIKIPLALFVYGDFVEDFPDLIREWSRKYLIGIREDGPLPDGHWELQYKNAMRMSIVSAERRLNEIGLQAYYVLPPTVNTFVSIVAEKRSLRLIQPTVSFPPKGGSSFDWKTYHAVRDVEKVPKALRWIHNGLSSTGGIISLDSDFPDNYIVSVFLLDYLVEASNYSIADLKECIR